MSVLEPGGLQDLGHARLQERVCKTKVWDIHEFEKAVWMNGIRWTSASSTKSLESGERDLEVMWSHEEDSLKVR